MISAKISPARPRILIECGPKIFNSINPAKSAKKLIDDAPQKHLVNLDVLIYNREQELAHTNHHVGGYYRDADDVSLLYQALNRLGLPFNLALNGSPDHDRHVPFTKRELEYLEALQASGHQAGLRNAVTIADNALLPSLRKNFSELVAIGSCIAAAFEPNLAAFRNDHGINYKDPDFFVEYYRHLYSIYDKVVPIPQLMNPAFMFALKGHVANLPQRTISFLNLGCGSPKIGRCVLHYQGIKNEVKPNMPVIPEGLLSKPEDIALKDETGCCKKLRHSLELWRRFNDLKALREMGFYQFKIPARESDERVLEFLFGFVCLDKPAETFPNEPMVWGYTQPDKKLSFIQNYPPQVHGVLSDFSWPGTDNYNGAHYCGSTASRIENDLHARALGLWKQSNS